MLDICTAHLDALVSMDTRNPPRAIQPDHDVIRYTTDTLKSTGFDVSLDNLGDGSICIDAVRGESDVLVNCHLDTVPDASGWNASPFTLSKHGDALIGLGACDVKGSAACILTAASMTDTPARILLTTDEEAGKSRCVRHWVREHAGEVSCVIVCEPTGLKGVTAHRGLLSAQATFQGRSAHSSDAAAASSSATHALVHWAHGVLSCASICENNRFNIGRIEGGTKPNMIAADASVRFGMRPAPDADPDELLERIKSHASRSCEVEWSINFSAPALRAHPQAPEWLERFTIEPAPPVDFWTEAALFAELGVPTIVFGAGDISQAHAPNERIAIAQLEQGIHAYANIFSSDHE